MHVLFAEVESVDNMMISPSAEMDIFMSILKVICIKHSLFVMFELSYSERKFNRALIFPKL